MSDLEKIRRSYELPDGFSLAVPSRDDHLHQPGFDTLYEDALIRVSVFLSILSLGTC